MARLVYTTDEDPGISRRRCGRGFTYLDSSGERISRPDVIERIRALAIPPAYRKVWICPLDKGHLQATGRDDRCRKQYRYHPEWVRQRNETKFARLLEFAEALPGIRSRVQRDLQDKEITRRRVIAAAIRVIDHTGARVGNPTYTAANGSYGVTTLTTEHLDNEVGEMEGGKSDSGDIELNYTGKGGKEVHFDFCSARVAKLLCQARDLPGEELFSYRTPDGGSTPIHASDVNDYLHEIADEITAKDFRTWKASLICFALLSSGLPPGSKMERDREIVAAVKETASHLHHRPATCRNYYVHPAILKAYADGEPLKGASRFRPDQSPRRGLSAMEEKLVDFVESYL